MNLTRLTENLNNIGSLQDKPSLTSAELKAKFDASGNAIKNYINNIMLDELEEQVNNEISSMQTQLTNFMQTVTETLNSTKPVGSLYLTVGDENPSTIWQGTTWQKIENRFLLGSGTRSVNATGGAETVTLNANMIPSHKHSVTYVGIGNNPTAYSVSGSTSGTSWSFGAHSGKSGMPTRCVDGGAFALGSRYFTNNGANDNGYDEAKNITKNTTSVGGGQAHNNMPPFLVVHIWKRIS